MPKIDWETLRFAGTLPVGLTAIVGFLLFGWWAHSICRDGARRIRYLLVLGVAVVLAGTAINNVALWVTFAFPGYLPADTANMWISIGRFISFLGALATLEAFVEMKWERQVWWIIWLLFAALTWYLAYQLSAG